MGYAEALEQQMAFVRQAERESRLGVEGNIQFLVPTTDYLDPDGGTEEEWTRLSGAFVRAFGARVAGAPTFWISPDVCQVVAAMAETLPESPLLREVLPEPHGFAYFATPMRFPDYMIPSGLSLRALYWGPAGLPGHWGVDPSDGVFVAAIQETSVGLDKHTNELYGRQYFVQEVRAWKYGEGHRASRYEDGRIWRLLEALWRFCRQPQLVSATRQPIMNRGKARRALELLHNASVNVIELRRREYQQHDESQGSGVEYSCQWLVRGHWHQYHTKEGLQPRWVAPYVKGPSDKPLRVAAQTAYAVVR